MSENKDKRLVIKVLRETAPFATVSGVLTTGAGMIEEIDRRIAQIGIITTKSYQVRKNLGNREPILVEAAPGCFGNAVGLRNPGMAQGAAELSSLKSRRMLRALLNVSLAGSSPEEFAELIRCFKGTADIFELNLSCPHAEGGYGMSIGTDPKTVEKYLSHARKETNLPIFAKLTPNTNCLKEIAKAAVAGGADGLSLINTAGPELFLEPYSKKPILRNNKDNRGGKSGAWIRETALKCVRTVRDAVGPDIPIIGMGGVSTGTEAIEMRNAGADIIGLGSVFASLHPRDWEAYFESLYADLKTGTDTSFRYLDVKRRMEYAPYRVSRIERYSGGYFLLELSGSLSYRPSEFAFLWLPGAGEKPFSIAREEPLTFFIREKGETTAAFALLTPGDIIYIRGIYGAAAPSVPDAQAGDIKRIIIAAGGTGLAVAPKLAEEHFLKGTEVTVYYGGPGEEGESLRIALEGKSKFISVPDKGIPGRAVDVMLQDLSETRGQEALDISNTIFYTVGPVKFMDKAARAFEKTGAAPE